MRSQLILAMCILVSCKTGDRSNRTDLLATGKEPVSDAESRVQIALVKYDRTKCSGDNAFISRCTATRINETTVLTAAHCVVKGEEVTEVFKIENFKALNEVMPIRDKACVPTAPMTKALLDIGGQRPKSVFVSLPPAKGPDLALLEFSELGVPIVPFTSTRPKVGSTIHKIGFGTRDCLEQMSDGSTRFDAGGLKYGIGRVDAILQDAESIKQFDPAMAEDPKRRFSIDLLAVSGVGGAYSCVGDSGAGALVKIDGQFELAGVHTGGVGLEDPATRKKGGYKLETAISIHSVDFCGFLQAVKRTDILALYPKGSGCEDAR